VLVGNDGADPADLCGGHVDASEEGTIGTYPWRRVMTFGPDVTDRDRAAAEEMWRTMGWTGAPSFYARGNPVSYVLDGWNSERGTSLLEVRPFRQNVQIAQIEVGASGDGASSEYDHIAIPPNVIQGDWVGAVSQDAARVELRVANGDTFVGRLIDLPPTLAFAFDAYAFEEQPGQSATTEVAALDTDGAVLGSNLPPATGLEQVGTLRAFGATWNVKLSSSTDGYVGAACVRPVSSTSTRPCERGFGNGAPLQTFDGPHPAVFVSQIVGDNVVSIDVEAADGTLFHTVRLPLQGGGFVAVTALQGQGRGRFVYHLNDGTVDRGSPLTWPDLGQVIGSGSFQPPT
jgi:hypothetical protein